MIALEQLYWDNKQMSARSRLKIFKWGSKCGQAEEYQRNKQLIIGLGHCPSGTEASCAPQERILSSSLITTNHSVRLFHKLGNV